MYENGKRPAKTILRRVVEGIKKNDGGVNLTKIYCKHFHKCHNVLPVQQHDDNENKIIPDILKNSS
jgi:hypothetical protein